ncbi:hypothetical protein B0T25DRAFT_560751 [Lasiosphaeria hispida]|uniref:Azaphilone pigments biosynthesis cluster protein L N-terminal domain-containing protein n=1 Tax=Lasiosphaeria hispida TaxID=260671 RepID=A0AAJ0H579_9PEZI|nr:hypothetical protein B0T25DRAFT_560751 [Lasiosphaeria hispida]
MADPLSIAAGVVGLLGYTLHGSKRMLEFIESIRNAPKDVAALSLDLRALHDVLATLAGMQNEFNSNPTIIDCLRVPLENCVDIFTDFTATLNQFVVTTRDGSMRVRTWKNIVWAFREKEISLFRDTTLAYKASLNMAVGAMTLFTATSIDERTKRIEIDMKNELQQIRAKLQALDVDRIGLASIAGLRGSELHGTEAGFALGRFLDYTGSLCNSPPPSFPGSPVIPPSDAGSLDTLPGTEGLVQALVQGPPQDIQQHMQPEYPPHQPQPQSGQEDPTRNMNANNVRHAALVAASVRADRWPSPLGPRHFHLGNGQLGGWG